MEILASNFVYKTSSTIQFLIPWVRRSRGICCSSEGTNNPSFPVRYVPKTSTKTEKPQTRLNPIKGSDTKIKKELDSNTVRLETSNRTVSQSNSALDMKSQSLYQGLVNGLANGSYQAEASEKIYHDTETMENKLKKEAEELEIYTEKLPLSTFLDSEENSDVDHAATRSTPPSGSPIPVQYVSKNSLKENGPPRPTPVKSSNVKVLKSGVDENVMKNGSPVPVQYVSKNSLKENGQTRPTPVKVANGSMVFQSRFSDKKLQTSYQKPAGGLSHFRQEANNEIKYHEETMDGEYMEEPVEKARELGLSQDLRACENKVEAEKAAIRLLATRAYTAVELRKKLHGKGFPTSAVDAIITDFQSRGLINDGLYAESYARSRWSSLTWGPRRVKQALIQKGITQVDTEEALKLVYEDGDYDSSLGLSKVSMDQLYTQASKQWLRSRDVSDETRKARIIRWLQYRGFNWGVTSFILKKLETKHHS